MPLRLSNSSPRLHLIARKKEIILKHLARLSLLAGLLINCTLLGVAQKRKQHDEPLPPAAGDYNSQTWKEFSSAEGRFAILFPGTPTDETQAVGAGEAQLEVHSYNLRTFADYSVAYVDYPIPVNNADIAKQVLDNVAQAELEGADAGSASVTEISLDGHPGRFLKLSLPGGRVMRNKMYLVGKRLYQVTITMPADERGRAPIIQLRDATATKFLNSFKLLATNKQ